MSLAELLPILQSLPRTDKLRVVQFLATELVCEEGAELLTPGRVYHVWSPIEAHEAAAALQKLLEAEKGQP
jgi:hypothetical protein